MKPRVLPFLVLVVAGALGVLTLASRPASAQPADAETRAKQHYERGQELYQAGSYADALAEFSAGYELTKRPLFLFNMAECARLTGNGALARSFYERYLREDPEGPLGEVARTRLEAMGVTPPPRVHEPPPSPPKANELTVDLSGARGVDRGPSRPTKKPIYRRWTFWTAVGGAVALGAAGVYVARSGDDVPEFDLR